MESKPTFSRLNESWRDADPVSQNLDALNRRAFVVKGEDRREAWNAKAFVRAYPSLVDAVLHVRYAVVEWEKERLERKARRCFGLFKGEVDRDALHALEETGRALETLAREVYDEGFTPQRRERFVSLVNDHLDGFKIEEARHLSEYLRDHPIREAFQEHFGYPIEEIDLTNGDHLAFLGFIPRWEALPQSA